MNVSTIIDGDTVRVRVVGELDVLTVSRFVPVLDDLLREPYRRWILDLSELRMIDSSGIGAIIYAFKKLRGLGGVLSVEGAAAQPLSILRLMRLDRVLDAT